MIFHDIFLTQKNRFLCIYIIKKELHQRSTWNLAHNSKTKWKPLLPLDRHFFCAWLTLIPHSQPTPFLVICPKQEKKSNFQHISLSTRSKSYGFIFFKNFLGQQYKRFWGSLCFSLIHRKGTSSPTPYNIKRLQQPSNIVHKKKRGNTSITR